MFTPSMKILYNNLNPLNASLQVYWAGRQWEMCVIAKSNCQMGLIILIMVGLDSCLAH